MWINGENDGVENSHHIPVLLEEIEIWLEPKSPGVYVDCTLGMGGTAARLLELSSPEGCLIGMDQDPEAVRMAGERLAPFANRFQLHCGNFKNVKAIVEKQESPRVNGIIFDLGISSAQLAQPQRGFSFLEDGPLDMRMSPSHSVTASDLVNTLPMNQLADLIYQNGEERFSRRIAKAIVELRKDFPLSTTFQLVDVIRRVVPPAYRHGRIHCATRTFQALRIAVNSELDVIEPALREAVELLAPGGRMGVISFHSLEDRIVKHTFRSMAHGKEALVSALTKKPIVASREEQQRNPRSRSAKFRVIERKGNA